MKSNEDFVDELKIKNPKIMTLEKYKGAITKINVQCIECGHVWQATPNGLLRPSGCPKCKKQYKMTHDEFVEKMATINTKIKVLGLFQGTSKNVQVKCLDCGFVWEARGSNLIKGSGCRKCNVSSLKRTHVQFVNELKDKNSYVEVVGIYKNVETDIEVKCLICGENYFSNPQRLLRGSVHKKCSLIVKPRDKSKYRKSHQQFLNEINALNKNVELLTEYIDQKTKVLIKCKKCGDERFVFPDVLLRKNGTGCFVCSMEIAKLKMRKTHDTFVDEVSQLNPHIEIISLYTKQDEKIDVKCRICGYKHTIMAQKLLTRIYNCPICSDKISFPNRFMASILKANNIDFESEKIFDWSDNKRYDFYIPSTSTIIEMNGEQHYRQRHPKSNWGQSLEDIQKNDLYKEKLAKDNDIKNYIIIDAMKSLPDYIINSVLNSSIHSFVENINITEVLEKCLLQSKIINLSKLYNQGITSPTELGKELKLDPNTCRTYIKFAQGAKLIA